MYLVGAEHPNKAKARAIVQGLGFAGQSLVTDAEVYQEVLHRYSSIGRPSAIQPAFDVLDDLVVDVFPIDRAVVDAARTLVLAYPGLSARDAVHVASMRAHGVNDVLSFDVGFDVIPGITRICEP